MLLVSKKFKYLASGTKHRALGLAHGQRVLRYRGAGVKNLYRLVDHAKLLWNVPGYIIRFEYAREALVSLISYENGVLAYQPTFLGSKIQDRVLTTNQLPLRRGYSAILKQFEYGQYIFNIEHKPFCGAVFCRAPGSIAKVIRHLETEVLLRLPSGTERWFNNNCIATLGSSALSLITLDRYLLAGYMRHLGWRPRVRGVAMNPVDHPHGGGEGKTSGGRISVSRWGWLTKNQKSTRKQIRKQYGKYH